TFCRMTSHAHPLTRALWVVVAPLRLPGGAGCARPCWPRLPRPWTALGAVCFAVSDAMIGIGRFSPASGRCPHIGSEAPAVPI
ncbi:MAG: hypothetical protein ABWY20_07475, partial [Mycobacterium sp.]